MIATGRHRPRGVLADRWLLAVIAMFLLSRSAAMAAGVRFDASPLGYFLQYLDPHLLRARLGESLWYLHSQPPLFNLLLGELEHHAEHQWICPSRRRASSPACRGRC